MESVLKQALPKEVIEVQEAVQEVVAPPDNRVRDFGILIGVVVLAAVCAKLYKCTAKKKK